MASRFHFSPSWLPTDGVTPAFAAWNDTANAVRRHMDITTVRLGLSQTASRTIWGGANPAANEMSLGVQLTSRPMTADIAFSTGDTIKGVIQCRVTDGVDEHINRQPLCLKVVSRDGLTLRATLFALAHAGPGTTEWTTTSTNRQFADGDNLQANYTTVEGDRLVLELGGQAAAGGGGTNVGAQFTYGYIVEDGDLAENEIDTTLDNPWFEISRDITFLVPNDQEAYMILSQWGQERVVDVW